MKPLLVGEANPYGADPRYALFPYPEISAGGRLCYKVMGLTRREYLERFDRVNLCSTKWSMREARASADRIASHADHRGRVIVLFGAKVWSAFGTDTPFAPFRVVDASHRTYVVLPHPSGLSRAWNEPGSYERARAVLREARVLS